MNKNKIELKDLSEEQIRLVFKAAKIKEIKRLLNRAKRKRRLNK